MSDYTGPDINITANTMIIVTYDILTIFTNVRVAEVGELDARIEDGRIAEYRAKVRLSFKVGIKPETL